MEAWIKYKGAVTDNYTRYGKEIPLIEKKIDLMRYFGQRNEEALIKSLSSDSRIEFKLHKGG